MEEEVTRQCELAWDRGYSFGCVVGVVCTLLFALIIKIVF